MEMLLNLILEQKLLFYFYKSGKKMNLMSEEIQKQKIIQFSLQLQKFLLKIIVEIISIKKMKLEKKFYKMI